MTVQKHMMMLTTDSPFSEKEWSKLKNFLRNEIDTTGSYAIVEVEEDDGF